MKKKYFSGIKRLITNLVTNHRTAFPNVGDCFYVKRVDGDPMYDSDVFECKAYDKYVVVGKSITRDVEPDSEIFRRNHWVFIKVSESVIEAVRTKPEW